MAVEEIESDVDVKPQISSSGEGLITYSRRKRTRSGRSRSQPADEVSNGYKISVGAAKRSRSSSQRSRSSYQRSRVRTRQFKAEIAEQSVKETHDTMLCPDTYAKDDLARKGNHWKNILENMLLLPDVLGGGGIRTCITDALVSDSSDLSRMFKLADVTKNTATAEPKDRYRSNCEEQGQIPRPDISANTQLDILEADTYVQNSLVTNTLKCQGVFLEILRSENFVLLCDLLGKNFQDMNAENLFCFSQINSKMKNGVYDQSPGLFDQDIQQVWRKFKRIGLEMVLFARNLSNMSREFYQKVVGLDVVYEDLEPETVEPQCKENQQVGAEQKNSNDLDIATPFPSCESNQTARPEQTEASCLYKVCTCKQCGTEANGERSLICDECEAVYHFTCAKPAVLEIPTQSWYCALCSKDSKQSPNAPVSNVKQDSMHDNCVVCDRLEFTEVKEHVKENCRTGSRESSVSSMESDDPPEPSRTALSRLCKHCGTCEDEDKRFLICGHRHCPYKFYHIRCLRTSQVASLQQRNKHCWYCPSCLCRACFDDKDDDKIVLCDGCDEAYHTYCMKPSRTTVPDGQWYCIQCNMAKAKEGMRRYEEVLLQLHGKKNAKHSDETGKPTDVLPSAVDKLSTKDHLLVARKSK